MFKVFCKQFHTDGMSEKQVPFSAFSPFEYFAYHTLKRLILAFQ